jgi:hypothetical protein
MSDTPEEKAPAPVKWADMTTFAKFLELFKWAGAVAIAVTAISSSCEAELARRRAEKSPEERVTKAAFTELSKKLNDLAKDIDDFEHKQTNEIKKALSKFRLTAANAEARAESVRSLFIGYALASRGAKNSKELREEMKSLTKSLSSGKGGGGLGVRKLSPPQKPTIRSTRRFRPVRKYSDIKSQTTRPSK